MVKHSKADLSSFEHGCIGAMVGSIEQSIMRPAVFWKAELQQDRFALSRAVNPRYFYRGLPVAVASIAPVTCIQFAATNMFVNAAKSMRGTSRSSPTRDADNMMAGVFAGVASSLAQSPFQLVEVNQQRSGGNMLATAERVVAVRGVSGLFRGLSMTAFREGIFCWGYVAMAPMLKSKLQRRRPGMSDSSALATAAVASGTIAGVLSHPADTLKTRLQGSVLDDVRPSGPKEALQQLRQSGPGGLLPKCYKGLSPRVFRLCCCTFIFGTLTDIMESAACRFHDSGGPHWGHEQAAAFPVSSQPAQA